MVSSVLAGEVSYGEEAGHDLSHEGLAHFQRQLTLPNSPCLVLRVVCTHGDYSFRFTQESSGSSWCPREIINNAPFHPPNCPIG